MHYTILEIIIRRSYSLNDQPSTLYFIRFTIAKITRLRLWLLGIFADWQKNNKKQKVVTFAEWVMAGFSLCSWIVDSFTPSLGSLALSPLPFLGLIDFFAFPLSRVFLCLLVSAPQTTRDGTSDLGSTHSRYVSSRLWLSPWQWSWNIESRLVNLKHWRKYDYL